MIGDAFALMSATFFSVANITIVRGTAPGDDDNGAFVSLLLTTLIAGIGWIAWSSLHGVAPITPRALAWFGMAGVLTAFVGRVFGYACVQQLGAMRASATKRLNPFFAVALGVGVLGERLTAGGIAGMLLIVASFVLLVSRGSTRKSEPGEAPASRIGYVYGLVSALGYATGYLGRKMGLAETPDALMGTMVGTLFGALTFVLVGVFNSRYAAAVRGTFSTPRPWLLVAGAMSSFGQIAYFFALREAPISRVALITSMEVFITIFLSVIFLRRFESLTPVVFAAALLGVVGTASIIYY
ncbi:MAG TPA: EamA family transporter [Usitatibacter sp.]|nr:EamA family transporter [Usitatibacter sp.]